MPAAAPVRLVHLGLGNFFRAHQAWFTAHAADADADAWGYAAFGGRGSALADRLAEQDGLYSLVTRTAGGDTAEVVCSISAVHGADDHAAWLEHFTSANLAAVTLTVTEAGYHTRSAPGGAIGIDLADRQIAADVQALRTDLSAPVRSAPGRLVAGAAARCRAGLGPVALVPCDNLPANGSVAALAVAELAGAVDAGLAGDVAGMFAPVTTVVDRITPRATAADAAVAAAATGLADTATVVTEPYAEWVLCGSFPARHPSWEAAGAVVRPHAADATPYEERKLRMLNGAHSLLAYAGSILGHRTVAGALDDPTLRAWVEQWWDEASPTVRLDPSEIDAYRVALRDRFANRRMRDQLARIAEDGSQKLPVRAVPVVRSERAAGRVPVAGAVLLAAWVCHLRGLGAEVRDVRAGDVVPAAGGPLATAVPRVLSLLGDDLAGDPALVDAVERRCRELAGAAGHAAAGVGSS